MSTSDWSVPQKCSKGLDRSDRLNLHCCDLA